MEKILIFMPAEVQEFLCLTPILSAVRAARPKSVITVACATTETRDIAVTLPAGSLDRVIMAPPRQSLAGHRAVLRTLWQAMPDTALVFSDDPAHGGLAFFSGARYRGVLRGARGRGQGLLAQGIERFLFTHRRALPVDSGVSFSPRQHAAVHGLGVLQDMGLIREIPTTEAHRGILLPPFEAEKASLDFELNALTGGNHNRPVVVMEVPDGMSGRISDMLPAITRAFPEATFLRLEDGIPARQGSSYYGGVYSVPRAAKTFQRLCAWIDHADIFIGSDGVSSVIAGALHRPAVILTDRSRWSHVAQWGAWQGFYQVVDLTRPPEELENEIIAALQIILSAKMFRNRNKKLYAQ